MTIVAILAAVRDIAEIILGYRFGTKGADSKKKQDMRIAMIVSGFIALLGATLLKRWYGERSDQIWIVIEYIVSLAVPFILLFVVSIHTSGKGAVKQTILGVCVLTATEVAEYSLVTLNDGWKASLSALPVGAAILGAIWIIAYVLKERSSKLFGKSIRWSNILMVLFGFYLFKHSYEIAKEVNSAYTQTQATTLVLIVAISYLVPAYRLLRNTRS
jgi:hypothetical protein